MTTDANLEKWSSALSLFSTAFTTTANTALLRNVSEK